MLWERSVTEQRYNAVLEVLEAGLPVTEVADRYGVSRQSVHAWIARYRAGGLEGLADRYRGFIGEFGWLDTTFDLWVYRVSLVVTIPLVILAAAALWRRRVALLGLRGWPTAPIGPTGARTS